uniref:Uncharacterized protein n=1 Tax=Oryza meridionalis TaxID=40149 RepID=A0A0E0CT25_9ORYZ
MAAAASDRKREARILPLVAQSLRFSKSYPCASPPTPALSSTDPPGGPTAAAVRSASAGVFSTAADQFSGVLASLASDMNEFDQLEVSEVIFLLDTQTNSAVFNQENKVEL